MKSIYVISYLMSLQLFHIAWASNLCTEKDYKNVRKEIAKYYQLNIF